MCFSGRIFNRARLRLSARRWVLFRKRARPTCPLAPPRPSKSEVRMEQRRNEGAGETGDPRENPSITKKKKSSLSMFRWQLGVVSSRVLICFNREVVDMGHYGVMRYLWPQLLQPGHSVPVLDPLCPLASEDRWEPTMPNCRVRFQDGALPVAISQGYGQGAYLEIQISSKCFSLCQTLNAFKPGNRGGTAVSERSDCSPPTKANRVQFPIFTSGNRGGRCLSSAGSLGDLPFPSPLHSGAAPYSPRFTLIGSQDLVVRASVLPERRSPNGDWRKYLRLGNIPLPAPTWPVAMSSCSGRQPHAWLGRNAGASLAEPGLSCGAVLSSAEVRGLAAPPLVRALLHVAAEVLPLSAPLRPTTLPLRWLRLSITARGRKGGGHYHVVVVGWDELLPPFKTVNSARYIEHIFNGFAEQLTEDERSNAYFQQDGATAHSVRATIARIESVFHQTDRVVSRATNQTMPPRSPDLSVCDSFVRGALNNDPRTPEELGANFITAIGAFPQHVLARVFRTFWCRLHACLESPATKENLAPGSECYRPTPGSCEIPSASSPLDVWHEWPNGRSICLLWPLPTPRRPWLTLTCHCRLVTPLDCEAVLPTRKEAISLQLY
ncbi:hypothetical protein PR048_004326 [Dryococelus australis]|uniref:Uncharacterized protein n=1 Tax=Dryococelus australis TaxID=614101 RepID=A0ABQ9I727_9NEOP|nr:hypothetical protein PR048_004326 [Dryococelus australis]